MDLDIVDPLTIEASDSTVEGLAMTPTTCLRCDWEGETTEARCPNCGEQPLYAVGASPSRGGAPIRNDPEDRSHEAPSRTDPGPSDWEPPRSEPPPPDPLGSSRRPSRSIIVFALAALVIVTLGTWLRAGGEGSIRTVSTDGAVSGTPTGDGLPTPVHSPSDRASNPGSSERLRIGTHSLIVEGVPFSFDVPARGWERFSDLYISKGMLGSQGAEAIIYWTGIGGPHAHPCGQWWGAPPGSMADYAANAARGRGTDLVTGPWDVSLGGRAAAHVVFMVRRDVGCNPGFFYRWREVDGSAPWTGMEVGDTVRVWIVDVGGTRLYIEGDTHEGADPRLAREIQRIVGSIRFD
jgi:hypothetical protein